MAISNNAILILKKDHLMVKGLFKSLKLVDKLNMSEKENLFNKLNEELDIHTHIEENIFYPALSRAGSEEEDMVKESYADHAAVKDLLQELATEDKQSPEWSIKLETLEEEVTDHVREEEDVLLPRAEEILGKDRLEELGQEMAAEKERMKGIDTEIAPAA